MSRSPVILVERKSKPESCLVTLEEVKSFLRVENDQDDKLILNLISGTTDYAEWHMEKSLMKQTWQISCEDYIPRRLYLSYGPIRAIISATATISKDQEERRNLKYYFSAVGGYVEFSSYFNITRVDVVYEAGYENVPEQIKLGIMQHVSDIYRNRSGMSSNLSEIKEVYSPFRELRVVL
jgi:uncharacterized phiE125 gp8 family phage protein